MTPMPVPTIDTMTAALSLMPSQDLTGQPIAAEEAHAVRDRLLPARLDGRHGQPCVRTN